MIIYQCRPGIVLTEICGEYLLVAPQNLRYTCPYLKQINETGAFIWKNLMSGCSIEQLTNMLFDTYDLPDKETAKKEIDRYVKLLDENNYLVYKNVINE